MADDFLGKKMDDYRRNRGLKPASRSASPTYLRPGHVQVPFTSITVALVETTDAPQWIDAIARELRSIDCRVAIVSPFPRSPLAQAAGCRYYPLSPNVDESAAIADIVRHWGNVDMRADIAPGCVSLGTLSVTGSDLSHVARVVRCLAELGDISIFARNNEIAVE